MLFMSIKCTYSRTFSRSALSVCMFSLTKGWWTRRCSEKKISHKLSSVSPMLQKSHFPRVFSFKTFTRHTIKKRRRIFCFLVLLCVSLSRWKMVWEAKRSMEEKKSVQLGRCVEESWAKAIQKHTERLLLDKFLVVPKYIACTVNTVDYMFHTIILSL